MKLDGLETMSDQYRAESVLDKNVLFNLNWLHVASRNNNVIITCPLLL